MALDGPSDQEILTKAFKAALTGATGGADSKTLFGLLDEVKIAIAGIQVSGTGAASNGGTPGTGEKGGSGETPGEDPNKQKNPFKDQEEEAEKTSEGVKSSLADMFKPLAEGVKAIEDTVNEIGEIDEKFREITNYATDMYDPIQEALGGVNDFGQATNETTRAVMENMEQVEQIYLSSGDTLKNLGAGLTTEVGGKQVNVLRKVFSNVDEMQRAAADMQNEFHDNYQLRYNEMNQAQKAQLITFEKGLGISGQKVAQLVQRQIQRTGKASTESLEKISAYAKSVSDATGVSFKQISEGIAEIILNVETFGNVQEDEAARIAGTLQQLGTSYRSFGNMVNKFMSFDTAASEIGKLTSVFGVHMDAMEMMQLANEDEEEFMHRMRDSFIEQGIAVEDLTKAQRNMLASTIGIQASEVENFFDPDLLEVDFDAMQEATDGADLGNAYNDMISNAKTARQTQDDLLKDLNRANFAPYRKQAFELANAMQGLKVEGFDVALEGSQMMHEGIQSAFGYMSGITKTAVDADLLQAEMRKQGMIAIADELKAGTISTFDAISRGTQENAAAMITIMGEVGEKGKEEAKNSMISLGDVRKATKDAAKDVADSNYTIDPTKFGLDATGKNTVREQLEADMEGIPVSLRAEITPVINSETMSKIEKIGEQQQIFVKEQNTVFEKITKGIGELTEKIVAKIEEKRVIRLETVAKIDSGVLFRELKDIEVDDQVFITKDTNAI